MIAEPRWADDGLVPVVVQDERDARVLMVAYMDAEALAATVASGELHFHSRSRNRLWRKGETSGNVLHLVSLDLDCDADAILAHVHPTGPACHRGTRSCFDAADAVSSDTRRQQGFAWLETLWQTIIDRRARRPAGSYTTTLLDGGVDAAGRKVTEEATEVLMAAKDDAAAEADGRDRSATSDALIEETADLLFHALVLLAEREQDASRVMATLATRHRGPRTPEPQD